MTFILLKTFVASALLFEAYAIKCRIGDETGVAVYDGFDYCTSKHTQGPFTSSYGGEKFERGFDKAIDRLETECTPKVNTLKMPSSVQNLFFLDGTKSYYP